MQRCLAFCACLFLGVGAYADAWWNADFPARIRVYLNTSIIDEDLIGFPLRIRIGEAIQGLAVVTTAGETLPHRALARPEGGMIIDVRVPHIAAGTERQSIDIYYGNPNAAAADATSLWDDHYVAIVPLARNAMDESTRQSQVEAVGAVNVGDAGGFSGQEGYFAIKPGKAAWQLNDRITISLRFNLKDTPGLQTLVSGKRNEGAEQWFNFGVKMPDTVHTNAASDGKRAPELNVQGIAPEAWHAATVVYDGIKKTRTICVDGVALQTDSSLPGPLGVDEIRVGRGVLHFEPWQVNGRLGEVRIADVARSDSWIRAETACLAEDNLFSCAGAPQQRGEPLPAPTLFALIAPKDGFDSRARAGVRLQWRPAAGAENYIVRFYDTKEAQTPIAEQDVDLATSYLAKADTAPGKTIYWSVQAKNETGSAEATERRTLSFYNWNEEPVEETEDKLRPALSPARHAHFEMGGYLRTRIDKVIQEYFLETPESSPAILQVFRDRDKTPVRDPLVPWAGEFAGKYLTGAQLTWRLTGDDELKATIDTFVKDLIACQAENGYLGPFPAASRLTGGNWDVWGHYHCMLGLMLYYEDTEYAPALKACQKAADLLFETFGPKGPTLTNDGAGGQMNMAVCHALVMLYKKTGIHRYYELAQYIVEQAWNEPGAGAYLTSALADKPVIEFPQHRWEAIHDWQVLPELYWHTGDEQYRKAFEHIWHSAIKGDRHNTGGVTSGEGFMGSPYHTGAIETCCTVAWIAMSVDMLRLTGNSQVADEIEWSTLNSGLGAIPFSGRSCAYNVPMDGTRTYGVELHWQAPKGGPDLNCCAVNANRVLGMISDWALMEHQDGLALNYFGQGMMRGALPSGNVATFKEETRYPADGKIAIELKLEEPETFTLMLRIPRWSVKTDASVNGERIEQVRAGEYLRLNRAWRSGDRIELALDFAPWFWPGAEGFSGKMSVYRGPILFVYDGRYNTVNPGELPAFDWRTIAFEQESAEGAIAPWILARAKAADGTEIRMVDFSSAGQTGNHYVSWLPAVDAPPLGNVSVE